MKRFKFRLSRVLEAKESLETLFAQRLADVERTLTKANTDLNAFKEKYAAGQNFLRELNVGPVDIRSIRNLQSFLEGMEQRIREQLGLVERISKDVLSARLKLLEMTREKKVLENLRSRLAHQHNRFEMKKESKVMESLFMGNTNKGLFYE